jgi:hypothetical protein
MPKTLASPRRELGRTLSRAVEAAVGGGDDHGFAWRPMPLQVRVGGLSPRPGQRLAVGKLGWCGCATGILAGIGWWAYGELGAACCTSPPATSRNRHVPPLSSFMNTLDVLCGSTVYCMASTKTSHGLAAVYGHGLRSVLLQQCDDADRQRV